MGGALELDEVVDGRLDACTECLVVAGEGTCGTDPFDRLGERCLCGGRVAGAQPLGHAALDLVGLGDQPRHADACVGHATACLVAGHDVDADGQVHRVHDEVGERRVGELEVGDARGAEPLECGHVHADEHVALLAAVEVTEVDGDALTVGPARQRAVHADALDQSVLGEDAQQRTGDGLAEEVLDEPGELGGGRVDIGGVAVLAAASAGEGGEDDLVVALAEPERGGGDARVALRAGGDLGETVGVDDAGVRMPVGEEQHRRT